MRLIDADALQTEYKKRHEGKRLLLIDVAPTIEPEKRTETHACDCISRQAAIEHLKKRLYETEFNSTAEYPYYQEIADNRVDVWMNEVPSVEPEIIRCKDCMWYNDGYCPNVDGIRKSDFYCADSERRTDG